MAQSIPFEIASIKQVLLGPDHLGYREIQGEVTLVCRPTESPEVFGHIDLVIRDQALLQQLEAALQRKESFPVHFLVPFEEVV